MKMADWKKAVAVIGIIGLAVSGMVTFAQEGEEPEAGAGYAYEQGEDHSTGGERFRKKRDDFIEDLGLTENQREALRQHREDNKGGIRQLHEATKAKQGELKNALEDPNTSESVIRSIAADLKDLEGQKVDHRVDGILTVRSILTPEQYAAFTEKMRERAGKHKEGRRDKKKFGKHGSWKRTEETED